MPTRPAQLFHAATASETLAAVTMEAIVGLPLALAGWRIAWVQPATEPIR